MDTLNAASYVDDVVDHHNYHQHYQRPSDQPSVPNNQGHGTTATIGGGSIPMFSDNGSEVSRGRPSNAASQPQKEPRASLSAQDETAEILLQMCAQPLRLHRQALTGPQQQRNGPSTLPFALPSESASAIDGVSPASKADTPSTTLPASSGDQMPPTHQPPSHGLQQGVVSSLQPVLAQGQSHTVPTPPRDLHGSSSATQAASSSGSAQASTSPSPKLRRLSSIAVGQGLDSSPPAKRRKSRSSFPRHVSNELLAWLFENHDNPYPTEEQKLQMAEKHGLRVTQINDWFINARRRKLKPLKKRIHEGVSGQGLKTPASKVEQSILKLISEETQQLRRESEQQAAAKQDSQESFTTTQPMHVQAHVGYNGAAVANAHDMSQGIAWQHVPGYHHNSSSRTPAGHILHQQQLPMQQMQQQQLSMQQMQQQQMQQQQLSMQQMQQQYHQAAIHQAEAADASGLRRPPQKLLAGPMHQPPYQFQPSTTALANMLPFARASSHHHLQYAQQDQQQVQRLLHHKHYQQPSHQDLADIRSSLSAGSKFDLASSAASTRQFHHETRYYSTSSAGSLSNVANAGSSVHDGQYEATSQLARQQRFLPRQSSGSNLVSQAYMQPIHSFGGSTSKAQSQQHAQHVLNPSDFQFDLANYQQTDLSQRLRQDMHDSGHASLDVNLALGHDQVNSVGAPHNLADSGYDVTRSSGQNSHHLGSDMDAHDSGPSLSFTPSLTSDDILRAEHESDLTRSFVPTPASEFASLQSSTTQVSTASVSGEGRSDAFLGNSSGSTSSAQWMHSEADAPISFASDIYSNTIS